VGQDDGNKESGTAILSQHCIFYSSCSFGVKHFFQCLSFCVWLDICKAKYRKALQSNITVFMSFSTVAFNKTFSAKSRFAEIRNDDPHLDKCLALMIVGSGTAIGILLQGLICRIRGS